MSFVDCEGCRAEDVRRDLCIHCKVRLCKRCWRWRACPVRGTHTRVKYASNRVVKRFAGGKQ